LPAKRVQSDNLFLRQLGKHIERLIHDRGYNSAYDFWVNKAGDHMSRATLNYILAGETDPKISTLRTLAQLLGITTTELCDFTVRRERVARGTARRASK
jgi:hypothetical protein